MRSSNVGGLKAQVVDGSSGMIGRSGGGLDWCGAGRAGGDGGVGTLGRRTGRNARGITKGFDSAVGRPDLKTGCTGRRGRAFKIIPIVETQSFNSWVRRVASSGVEVGPPFRLWPFSSLTDLAAWSVLFLTASMRSVQSSMFGFCFRVAAFMASKTIGGIAPGYS